MKMGKQMGTKNQGRIPEVHFSRSDRNAVAEGMGRKMNTRYPLRGTASKLCEDSIETLRARVKLEQKPQIRILIRNGVIAEKEQELSRKEEMILREYIEDIIKDRIPNDNWLRKFVRGIKMPGRERVTREDVREWIRRRNDIFTPKVMEMLVQSGDREVGNDAAAGPVMRRSRSPETKPRGVNKKWRFRLRSRTVISNGSSNGSSGSYPGFYYVPGRRTARRSAVAI